MVTWPCLCGHVLRGSIMGTSTYAGGCGQKKLLTSSSQEGKWGKDQGQDIYLTDTPLGIHFFHKSPLSIAPPPCSRPCKLMFIGELNHWLGQRSPDLIFSGNVLTDYSEACSSKLQGFSQSNELNKQEFERTWFSWDTKTKQAT